MSELYLANNLNELIGLLRNSRRKNTKQYSYRQLANKLGYRSPRTLAMVHKGTRNPSANLVKKLIEQFAQSDYESEFIKLLAEKSIAEKKRLETIHLKEKISRYKIFFERLKHLDMSAPETTLEANLQLSTSELMLVRELIQIFFVEITEKYSKGGCEKLEHQFSLKIHINSS